MIQLGNLLDREASDKKMKIGVEEMSKEMRRRRKNNDRKRGAGGGTKGKRGNKEPVGMIIRRS